MVVPRVSDLKTGLGGNTARLRVARLHVVLNESKSRVVDLAKGDADPDRFF